jgi:Ca-activated chloride channel family protein
MKLLVAVLGCGLLWVPAIAQSLPQYRAADQSPEPTFTVRTQVDEVRVLFTVTDRHNRPVADLRREQVSVFDEFAPAATITDFRREADLPLRLGLLVDASDSVDKEFVAEQRAAQQFFARVLRRDRDAAFVISFGAKVRVAQELTSDGAALQAAIAALPRGGMTSLYDAVYQACSQQFAAPDPGLLRRGIILLSDGDDTYSLHSLDDAIAAAERAEVAVYPIALSRNLTAHGEAALHALARATGGRVFAVSRTQDIDRAFGEIEDELRAQYSVAFRPAKLRRDGHFHAVLVRVRGADVAIHARAGYFAPAN